MKTNTIRSIIGLFIITLSISVSAQQLIVGSANSGGNGGGTIYTVKSDGSDFTVLKKFINNPGQSPQYTQLAEGPSGEMYGITYIGGAFGSGVLFKYLSGQPNTELLVHFSSFNTSGTNPSGRLIFGSDGLLYGTTANGGNNNSGTIYRYNIGNGDFEVVHHFNQSATGRVPFGGLVQAPDGMMYGMTFQGGINNVGAIYRLDPATGTVTKLKDFANDGVTGFQPYGHLTYLSGKLYGMTFNGGSSGLGVLFEYDLTTGTYTKKLDLTNITGYNPRGSLTARSGKLWGLTLYGGTNGQGVIFEYDPSTNVLTKRHDFIGGASSNGSLELSSNDQFYGVTLFGGLTNSGVLFRFDPTTSTYTKLHDFVSSAGNSGYNSYNSPLVHSDGKIYIPMSAGGLSNSGTLVTFDPSTGSQSAFLSFNDRLDGANPNSGTVKLGDFHYATTQIGGQNSAGTISKIDIATGTVTKVADFNSSTTGNNVFSRMVAVDQTLYGLAFTGGTFGAGTIFRYNTASGVLEAIHHFDNTNGRNPYGELVLSGNVLYGVTNSGGTFGAGVVFSYDLANSQFTKRADFNPSTTGSQAYAGLTAIGEGKFIGSTLAGALNGRGSIYEFDANTNAITNKTDLSNNSGYNIYSTFKLASDGNLYGTAAGGGSFNGGTLLRYLPSTGVLEVVRHMAAPDGTDSRASLEELGQTGRLFGQTVSGGSAGYGTLFEYNSNSGLYSTIYNFNQTDGSQPLNGGISLVITDPSPQIQTRVNGNVIADQSNYYFPPSANNVSQVIVTLVNQGLSDLEIGTTGITGNHMADFAIVGSVPTTIQPGKSASITVNYSPKGNGIREASLSIPSNDPNIPVFTLNLTGPGWDIYGPVNPPIGTVSTDFSGEAGRTGGRTITVTAVSLSLKTDTYWGPQVDANGKSQIKVSLDGSTYTNNEILTYDPTLSNLSSGVAVFKGSTFIQNAVSNTINPVYIRATLTTKRPDNSVWPMIDPTSLGATREIGGLIKFTSLADYLVANYFIEASTSPNGPFQPYLDFYDAYPTPPGPLPGQGIGAAYSSVSSGYYWKNLPPRLTANQIPDVQEGGEVTITTTMLNATDDEDLPASPESIVFEFRTNHPEGKVTAFGTGSILKDGIAMTMSDRFSLKDLQDGKIKFQHNGSETIYDEFQFSFRDSRQTLGQDGPNSVFNFKFNIIPVNDLPVSANQEISGSYAAVLDGLISATDADNAGTELSFEVVDAPQKGILALEGTSGNFTYTPGEGVGVTTDFFTFRVFDGTGYSESYTITILLSNLPPVVSSTQLMTRENQLLTGQLEASDLEGENVTFSVVNSVQQGLIELQEDGSFSYQPELDYFGLDAFTFTATDAGGQISETATVSIFIIPGLDEGDLMIADRTAIKVYDPITGLAISLFEGNLLEEVQNVTATDNSSFYAIDQNNGIIKLSTIDGSQSQLVPATSLSSNPGALNLIIGLEGELIVADGTNGIVAVDTVSGNLVPLFSGGNIQFVTSLLQKPDGSLIVSDAGVFAGSTSEIILISPDGTQNVISTGGYIGLPVDIDFVDDNTIVVSDGGGLLGGTDKVYLIDLVTGDQTLLMEGSPLSFPTGVDYDPATGLIYVINQSGTLVSIDPSTGTIGTIELSIGFDRPFGISGISPSNRAPEIIPIPEQEGVFGEITELPLSSYIEDDRDAFEILNLEVVSVNNPTVLTNARIENGILKVELSGAGNSFLTIRATDSRGASREATVVYSILKASASVILNNTIKTYDAAATPVGFTTMPEGLAVDVLYNGQSSIPVNAGTYSITATISDPNYAGQILGEFTIEKAVLEVTASNAVREYGLSNPAFDILYEGFLGSDGINNLTESATASTVAVVQSVVGEYEIKVNGGSSDNYIFNRVSGILNITPATLILAADNAERIYGEPEPAFTFQATGFRNNEDISVLTQQPVLSTTASITSATGQYPIVVQGGLAQNYIFEYSEAVLTINKAELIVTASDVSRTYGNANPSFTLLFSGFKNNDNSSVIDVLPLVTTSATPDSDTGNYPIEVQGGEDNNYTFVLVNGTLIVEPALQSIQFVLPVSVNETIDGFILEAESTSGLPVSFISEDVSKIEISDNIAFIKAPGRARITAIQEGNNNYEAAVPVTQSLCITPAKPVITAIDLYTKDAFLVSSSTTGNQWYLNGNELSGQTEQTVNIDVKGSYQVKVTVDDCVSELSDIFFVSVTSTLQNQIITELYPNPADNYIHLDLNNQGTYKTLIFDNQGRVVRELTISGQNVMIDVSELHSGIYHLSLQDETTSQRIRFIKR